KTLASKQCAKNEFEKLYYIHSRGGEMKRQFILLFIISILAIFATACGSKDVNTDSGAAGKVVVKHQFGETLVKKNPEKVVAFDFGVLDTLNYLGIEVIGVPKGNIPKYLKKYDDDKYA